MTDLIVIGAGVAGMCAARRAQQLGLDVTVLEKAAAYPDGGNMVLSGGWFHAAYRSPLSDPAELLAAITESTDGHTRPDVSAAWAANVGRAFEFLSAEGAPFSPIRRFADGVETFVIEPVTYGTALGRAWFGSGPHRLAELLRQRFVTAGGELLLGRRADQLVHYGARITGVGAGGQRWLAPWVLIADGGFQACPELVAEYITPVYQLRGGPGDTGDGLRLGIAAGAEVVEMRAFYGHCLFRAAGADDRLWPEPEPSALLSVGALVGSDGARLLDERLGNHHAAAAIAASASPGDCWLVFDEPAWQTQGRAGLLPPNPTLLDAGATVVQAADVTGLAAAIGVDAASLSASIAAVPRIGPPPYRAVAVVAGITFTMGGLLVNGRAEVLDRAGHPIAGLLAAGGAMGGLHGGPRSGYAGGWSEAATFGLLAAETAAGDRLSS